MSTTHDPEIAARWQTPLPLATRQHLARLLVGDAAEPAPGPAITAEAAASPADPAVTIEAVLDATMGPKIGLVSIPWPGLAHPLWLRAGSTDATDCIAIMRDFAVQLRIPFAPRRIVEIGAGAGYRSVALALAHPDATIASLQPIPTLARVHTLNTLPYHQIIGVRLALSETARHYNAVTRPDTGRSALIAAEDGPVRATPLAELYRRLGWDSADILIIDPDFCAGLDTAAIAPALALARLIAIARPGPDAALPAELLVNLPDATHARRAGRDYDIFFKREFDAPSAPPRRRAAFDVSGATVPCERIGIVSEPWAFFTIGDTGFRLHPNAPGAPRGRLILRPFLAGPRRFETIVRLNNADANPVRFRVTIFAGETDRIIHRDDVVLSAGETRQWGADLPLYFGEAKVEFATEMADPASGNGFAWAEFLDPGFL